jgi:hypothetical protein
MSTSKQIWWRKEVEIRQRVARDGDLWRLGYSGEVEKRSILAYELCQ